MILENMIEQVQDLHLAVHNEIISPEEIEERYDCRLTNGNLCSIREQLSMLHHYMMVPAYGQINTNDL